MSSVALPPGAADAYHADVAEILRGLSENCREELTTWAGHAGLSFEDAARDLLSASRATPTASPALWAERERLLSELRAGGFACLALFVETGRIRAVQANWLPWVIGGGVALVVLGGVVYAASRSR